MKHLFGFISGIFIIALICAGVAGDGEYITFAQSMILVAIFGAGGIFFAKLYDTYD